MEILTNPLWITYHQTPVHFKVNKARIRKKTKCWVNEDWNCTPRACKSVFLQALSFLASQKWYQAQNHPPLVLSWECSVDVWWALPAVPPGRDVNACQWKLACVQVSTGPSPEHYPEHYHSLTIWQLHCTGEQLRCMATDRSEYFQKDLISFSHYLQDCFVDIRTQIPLKAKQFAPQANSLWGSC